LHIGYVYGSEIYPPHVSHYKPKFVEGARLPHVWIKILPTSSSSLASLPSPLDLSYLLPEALTPEQVADRQYSILDLCTFDSFTIIICADFAWDEAADEIVKALARRGVKCGVVKMGREFDVLYGRDWVSGMGFEGSRGVVVRPDQHILCLAKMEAASKDIMERYLCF
jgi:hypothetical protein